MTLAPAIHRALLARASAHDGILVIHVQTSGGTYAVHLDIR